MKNVVAYVPVLHGGYITFFKKYQGALYLVGPDFVSEELPRLIRDLRQVDVGEMARAIQGLNIFEKVDILTSENVRVLNTKGVEVVMPDEDISHELQKKYFTESAVSYENVFLRWDKPITLRELEVSPDKVISNEAFDFDFIQEASQEAKKSSDWWRQIGAVVVRDKEIVLRGHNKYVPTDYNLFATGNPRDNFDAGEHPEIYTSIHSEASIIAQAAREGVSLKGTHIYVTTFPCANCARLIAEAGITKVYYRDGYSVLDAEDIFKAYKIEVVLVRGSE
jgi:dCMP deaminase